MMESITIYPKSKKQQSLLKSLLEEMKVRFEIGKSDDTAMSEEEFYKKIDLAKEDIKQGRYVEYTPELREKLFKSIL
ncbi:hypothetical protein G5B30_02825 [Sphingobacterium sp. SGG-5]|uniref:DUF2683 family protein n=1 Tax=Sphingobacterium sp. SGG-5 TaxID=2710881 RepID=UPI0013EBBD60|nr:DUF2683 family protein [Sphingobacterium sp. SGG-5]NGM60845.1 hypothetical protein [Sphingobacterium sp. SGG-5]